MHHTHLNTLISVCFLWSAALSGCAASGASEGPSDTSSAAEEVPQRGEPEGERPSTEATCQNLDACPIGAFACAEGRCQLPETSTCEESGLGASCTFTSTTDGVVYEGRCAFHGGEGGYRCAPDCTETPCAQAGAICHPIRPTGQPGDLKACIPPCTDTYECLGGAWECNSLGRCVLPNEAACVGKYTLNPCSFEGSDGTVYEGICSTPPPTIDGPPYYSDTNLCVTTCDPDDESTCDRFLGVCQAAEAHGAGSGPQGQDYAVCVAPVCDGDEDCPGGMFGCDAATCVVPSITACEGKEAGTPCSRMVGGSAVEGFCSGMDLCLPACVSDEEVPHGDCTTNPASTLCVDVPMPDGSTQGLCIPRI